MMFGGLARAGLSQAKKAKAETAPNNRRII